MSKYLYGLLAVFLFFSCSRDYRILEFLESQKDYKLYIIPINKSEHESVSRDDVFSIKKPIMIDDQSTLQSMKKDWVLQESSVPKEKHIYYHLFIVDERERVLSAWLDDQYKILIWDEYLLSFHDSLLFKYEDSFTYLPGFALSIDDIHTARTLRNELIAAGGIITHQSQNNRYWKAFDGKYRLRRSRGDLEPSRRIGKLREKIKKDFTNNDYQLIDFEFDADPDSMSVLIASDSTYIEFIPDSYVVVGFFQKFDRVRFSCVGLDETQLRNIATRNNLDRFKLKEWTY